MRVCFYLADQNPHRDRTRGVTGYTDGLLSGLTRRPEVYLHSISSRSSYRHPNVDRFELPFTTDWGAGRLVADHLWFRLAPGRPDIWHLPKGYVGGLGRPRQPLVTTVHDLILAHNARSHPQSRSASSFAYWLALTRRSLATSDHILTISQHSRGQIERFAEEHHILLPAISVTYQGARWEEHAGETVTQKDDYVLHLASTEPHKRTETLVRHWARLWNTGALPRLLIVGSATDAAAEAASRCAGVTLRPAATSDELPLLLGRALALALPSEIEGFGLPALEAYYLGTPVVYVRDTAVEEVLGGAPGGFDLDTLDSLDAAVGQVLALTPSAVAEAARRLRERFAWSVCVERTLKAYRSVVR